jgi:hypothetical protein
MENQIIFYQNETGNVSINVTFHNESFWLTQKAIAQLFGVEVPAISKHFKNIFESGELNEISVISKMETTASDGKNYLTTFYNLDVTIAKNYLNENEIGDLNLLVSAYLDLAEFQARRSQLMNMKDWLERTNKFLESNSLDVLPNAGSISHEQAVEKAHSEYEEFRVEQDRKYISDLEIKKITKK